MAKKAIKHVGFAGAVAKAKAGGAYNPAAAIASAAQKASPAAKKANPRINRVAGVGKKGKKGAGVAG